jgi:hypothetical protein
MGMYTGLRAHLWLKPEYREAIYRLHTDEPGRRHRGSCWRMVVSYFPGLIPNGDGWLNYERHDFIPFGGLACMPEDFSQFPDGEAHSHFDKNTGEWTFCCSLKNYNDEIEFFVEQVLRPMVARADYCERLYEEYPTGDHHPFDNSPLPPTTWRDWVTKYLKDLNHDGSGVLPGH